MLERRRASACGLLRAVSCPTCSGPRWQSLGPKERRGRTATALGHPGPLRRWGLAGALPLLNFCLRDQAEGWPRVTFASARLRGRSGARWASLGQRGRAAPGTGRAGRGPFPTEAAPGPARPAQRWAPRPCRRGSGGLGLLLGLQAGLPRSMKSQEQAI